MLMKKKIILILVAAIATVLAVSCGAASGQTEERIPAEAVFAEQIMEGSYAIDVSSSSSMFRIVDAELTVRGDAMSVVMTMSGTGYDKIYMGTGEEALLDTDENCIYPVEDAEGAHTYQVPVAALDKDIDCTALSTRKQTWYDRILVFQSGRIPEDAWIIQPEDGVYHIDVTLSGGSGRASITSPAQLTVDNGSMSAVIEWSSPYYDLMIVDGGNYYPVNSDENAVFKIPVAMLSRNIAVSAETVAMSEPHMIDYILYFDASSLRKAGALKFVMPAVLALAAAAGILAAMLTAMKRKIKAADGK